MKSDPQIYVKDSVEAVVVYQKAFGLTLGMTAVNHANAVLIEGARNKGNGPGSPGWDTSNENYGFDLVDRFGVHWGVFR